MIAETANLTAGLEDVKEAAVATNTRRESSKHWEEARIFPYVWLGTNGRSRMSKSASAREAVAVERFQASRGKPSRRGRRVSYGEQIALRSQAELNEVAPAALVGDRSTAQDQFLDRTEDQFLEKLKRRDAAAFEQLVAERTGDIYGLLFRLTGDAEEARDLAQETFLRAFQAIEKFRGDADLKTWLYRIAINQARNRWRWWRRRRRDATISLDATIGEREQTVATQLEDANASDPEQEALARERRSQLREALQELRSAYRETVVLRDIEGLTYEEIAATLQINIGTVKSRLARGRLELRRKLESSL
jgi:RNA polymerase sigma-70 factor, ECF subfamily